MRTLTLQLSRVALASVCFSLFSATTQAQFTSVGPFIGSDQEGFETQDTSNNAFPTCVEDRVFGGVADLCGDTGSAHITGGWGFGCSMQEHSGARLLGCTGGPGTITFDTYALKFGGYFGTNNPSASDGLIFFFDASGTLLYSDTITAPNDCTWTWNGWDFGGTSVKSIRVMSNYSTGSYMLMDDLEAEIIPGSVGNPMCACDGSQAPAPCGNMGSPGRGCSNSYASSGGRLHASGAPSVSASSLVLHGVDLIPNWDGVFFQGDVILNNGSGYVFGDGLRCVGMNIKRLEVAVANTQGLLDTTVDLSSVNGNVIAAGSTKYYQLWYRDNTPGPCSSGFNLTNALEIAWTP